MLLQRVWQHPMQRFGRRAGDSTIYGSERAENDRPSRVFLGFAQFAVRLYQAVLGGKVFYRRGVVSGGVLEFFTGSTMGL